MDLLRKLVDSDRALHTWLWASLMTTLPSPPLPPFIRGRNGMSGKPPRASREGVRLTRLPINADLGRPSVELGLTIRPLAQALMEAIRWLVEHGHVRRPLPALRAQETGDLEAEQPFT